MLALSHFGLFAAFFFSCRGSIYRYFVPLPHKHILPSTGVFPTSILKVPRNCGALVRICVDCRPETCYVGAGVCVVATSYIIEQAGQWCGAVIHGAGLWPWGGEVSNSSSSSSKSPTWISEIPLTCDIFRSTSHCFPKFQCPSEVLSCGTLCRRAGEVYRV